jgi:hypothetical protein
MPLRVSFRLGKKCAPPGTKHPEPSTQATSPGTEGAQGDHHVEWAYNDLGNMISIRNISPLPDLLLSESIEDTREVLVYESDLPNNAEAYNDEATAVREENGGLRSDPDSLKDALPLCRYGI